MYYITSYFRFHCVLILIQKIIVIKHYFFRIYFKVLHNRYITVILNTAELVLQYLLGVL